MELIEQMQKDYRRIMMKTVLLTPLTFGIGRFYLWSLPLLVGMPLWFLPLLVGMPALFPIELAVLVVVVLPCAGVVYTYIIPTPQALRIYYKSREKFLAKVQQLPPEQYELLLFEYPTAKKIPIYYDRWKLIRGSEAIYVTPNFLFVPGLFLIEREEIEEIILHEMNVLYYKPQVVFSFTLKNQSKQHLMVAYSYSTCPETAEQIMAWFWGCDPNDPKLWMWTSDWFNECQKRWILQPDSFRTWRQWFEE